MGATRAGGSHRVGGGGGEGVQEGASGRRSTELAERDRATPV